MQKRTTILTTITILFFTITGCNKDTQTIKQIKEYKKAHPISYIIDSNKVFTEEDSYHPNDKIIKNKINTYFTKIWDAKDLSGGILIARGNNILFEKYRGYANIESQQSVSSSTPMHVASISKVITSLAVLKLIENEKLKLEQKITDFFPDFPYPDITIKELLNHRSGLPNYAYVIDEDENWDKNIAISTQGLISLFATKKPNLQYPVNTHFYYSNTNFALLALIIEKIMGKKFPEVADSMIFKPLGMKNSFIFQEKDWNTATPSYYSKGQIYPLNHLDLIYGDKNVYTTPQDLFKLNRAMFAPDFLKKELLNLMYTPYSNEKPGINNYGLGMRMMIFDNGKKITYHNGWWHGSNAVFVHLIDEKTTIIAIGNKFSKSVYSIFKLIPLFGDYPIHLEKASQFEVATDTNIIKAIIESKE